MYILSPVEKWYHVSGLNRRPSPCKGVATSAELTWYIGTGYRGRTDAEQILSLLPLPLG
jgi:hypothetical protein